VKKLISIGVAVALLAMVVLPVAVAADECYTTPATYAKIPFAIVQSGFQLVGSILTSAGSTLGLPTWINASLMNSIGGWAGGPLGWSVDMLAWGVDLGGTILGSLASTLGLPTWLAPLMSDLADGLRECWTVGNCTAGCVCISGNCTP
jgi:hypothetical protein